MSDTDRLSLVLATENLKLRMQLAEAISRELLILREEPNEKGQYIHASHCDASRKEPMGNDGCSCAIGRRIKSLQSKLAATEERLRIATGQLARFKAMFHEVPLSEAE